MPSSRCSFLSIFFGLCGSKSKENEKMAVSASGAAPPFTFIPASDLMKMRNSAVAIVDVRDEERQYFGHIAGSLYYPSETFEENIPKLLRDLKGCDTAVFHCAKSQIRGPSCARSLVEHLNKARHAGIAVKLPKVVVLKNGFDGWSATGWPVCTCKEAKEAPCTHKP